MVFVTNLFSMWMKLMRENILFRTESLATLKLNRTKQGTFDRTEQKKERASTHLGDSDSEGKSHARRKDNE